MVEIANKIFKPRLLLSIAGFFVKIKSPAGKSVGLENLESYHQYFNAPIS